MAVIEAKQYRFTYPNSSSGLNEVSFSIQPGQVILMAGNSGSGKSTLLKSLNGLIPEIQEGAIQGELSLEGESIRQLPIYQISEKVGSVFQNPRSQFFTLNSTSELVFTMENYGKSREEMQLRIEELSSQLPIAALMDREISTLSSGERQILALASALSLAPGVLLFDEPSANLDYANAMRLRRIIQQLKKEGMTILVADHRFFYLNGLIDQVLLLQNQTVQVFDSEEAFKASDYPTRSFELFKMNVPTPLQLDCTKKEEVARLVGVGKWQVLQDVSFSLNRGEITTLVGVNGAGKTTLGKLLTGSLKPDKGEVSVTNLPFYVMQDADYQLFGTSVEQELTIGNAEIEKGEKQQILKELGLWDYRNSHPFELSGGEKQRLQIALAALSSADLIILDEPTSGLDIACVHQVVEQLKKLAQTKAVLVISHDYELIKTISHRLLYLDKGRISELELNQLDQVFKKMEESI